MTKVAGTIFFALAAITLILAISNFAAGSSSAGMYADSPEKYGLTTTTTDLRFGMGTQFGVQLAVTALLAIIGWFLHGSETEQLAYVLVTGLLLIAMLVVRFTPVLPMDTARISPGTAFFGAQVRLEATADNTQYYVTLPPNPFFRIATVSPTPEERKAQVLLDFRGDQTLLSQYMSSQPPCKILGSVAGTRVVAREKINFMLPRIKVFKVGE